MKQGTEIIVVDDEANLCFVLDKLLTDEGHAVTTASSGEEAFELYQKHNYPLLIVDIRLPGMSGLELSAKIREINPDAQVVVMTSHAQFDYAAEALHFGAYEFLLKPFENLELVTATVARAIEKIEMIEGNKALLEKLKHDTSELEDINKVLRDLSIRDGLTGLFNRRYINEYLKTELARARRHEKAFSVLFLDIDKFKLYNDNYGHTQGDALLREFSLVLQDCMRNSDLAARYGGEEFLLVLPETPKAAAEELAEFVLHSVQDYKFSGPDVTTTVSIGVATYPNDGIESSDIIKAADEAMYQVKSAGGNQVAVASAAK